MDDVRDEYGGWHNPDLSPKGIKEAKETADKLKAKNLAVNKILSSPFKRAKQTAEIIGGKLGLKVDEWVYLKERNSYGLLCGVKKTEAKEKYPELVAAYDEGREVLGYEDYDFLVKRVRVLIEFLKKMDEDVIAVTHGKLIAAILTEIVGKKPSKLEQNCLVEMEITESGVKIISQERVEF